MSPEFALDLVRRAILVSLTVSAPLLLTAMLVGVAVSLIQAITQLQEQTLTFIPKLLLMAFVFVLALPWIASQLLQYLIGMFRTLPSLVA